MWRPIHVSRRLAIEIGLGLLVIVAALLGAVWYVRYTRVETPAAQPYELTRPANMPYDGSAYVEYLTGRAAVNPNVPISGAGSAYDGRAYGAGAPLVLPVNPNVPISGTGSAYNPR
jgi:hypothetical protein